MKCILCALALCIATGAIAAGRDCTDDFKKAQEEATKEKKLLLLRFTVADSSGGLNAIYDRTFSKIEFRSYAKKNLVMVKVESYQRNSPLSDAVKNQNQSLISQYGVKAYPAAVLVDAQGKELDRLEGISGDGGNMLKELMAKLTAHSNN